TGGQHGPGRAGQLLATPDLAARHGVPGRHVADELTRGVRVVAVVHEAGAHVDGQVGALRLVLVVLGALHHEVGALGRDVDQTGVWVPGVGVPALAALHAGRQVVDVLVVI